MKENLNRRTLLNNALKTGLATLAGASALSANANSVCRLTANQPEGPFYPVNDQTDKDNDLTSINSSQNIAKGEIVILKGLVRDQYCQPIKGALVEIWQACETGKYNHFSDPNPAALDPHFQYWGKAITNEKGEYAFKTIKPGQYQASTNWIRPPHIHVKVHLRGHRELITQVYFAENKRLNAKDRILQSLSDLERSEAICTFKKLKTNSLYRTGEFDMTLQAINS
jgi:protocatechuate 3,4-dioxygenase beta subunit